MEDTVKDPAIRLVEENTKQKIEEATVLFEAARTELVNHQQMMARRVEKIKDRVIKGNEKPLKDARNLTADIEKKEKLFKAKNAANLKMNRAKKKLEEINEAKQGNEDKAKAKHKKTASKKAPEKSPEKVFEEKNAERMAKQFLEYEMNSFHEMQKEAMKQNKRDNEAEHGNEDEANAKRIKTDSEKDSKDEETKRMARVKATQYAKKVAEATKRKEEQELVKQEKTRQQEKAKEQKRRQNSMDVISNWERDIHYRENRTPNHKTFTGDGNTTEENKNEERWEYNLSMPGDDQEKHIKKANDANRNGDSNAFKRLPSSMGKEKTIHDNKVKKARRFFFKNIPSKTPGADYDPHDAIRYFLPRYDQSGGEESEAHSKTRDWFRDLMYSVLMVMNTDEVNDFIVWLTNFATQYYERTEDTYFNLSYHTAPTATKSLCFALREMVIVSDTIEERKWYIDCYKTMGVILQHVLNRVDYRQQYSMEHTLTQAIDNHRQTGTGNDDDSDYEDYDPAAQGIAESNMVDQGIESGERGENEGEAEKTEGVGGLKMGKVMKGRRRLLRKGTQRITQGIAESKRVNQGIESGERGENEGEAEKTEGVGGKEMGKVMNGRRRLLGRDPESESEEEEEETGMVMNGWRRLLRRDSGSNSEEGDEEEEEVEEEVEDEEEDNGTGGGHQNAEDDDYQGINYSPPLAGYHKWLDIHLKNISDENGSPEQSMASLDSNGSPKYDAPLGIHEEVEEEDAFSDDPHKKTTFAKFEQTQKNKHPGISQKILKVYWDAHKLFVDRQTNEEIEDLKRLTELAKEQEFVPQTPRFDYPTNSEGEHRSREPTPPTPERTPPRPGGVRSPLRDDDGTHPISRSPSPSSSSYSA